LKPLDPSPVKAVRLDTTHKIIEIAPGVKFSAWTFAYPGMASLAISLDPRRGDLATVQEILDRRLSAMGLSLLAMRVMNGPGDLAAVRRPR
jgi:hypothetical protein